MAYRRRFGALAPQPRAADSSQIFPLSVAPSGRYLQQVNGLPFPILARAYWGIIGLDATSRNAALDDLQAKGFNAFEFRAPDNSRQDNFVPLDGSSNLPFTTKIGGGAYTGSYTETPDFATTNEPYWQSVDALISACSARGIAVLWFPAYVGYVGDYSSTTQGWMQAMVDNGSTKINAFGAFVATRYKGYGNIIWMLGGDFGTGSEDGNEFSGSQITVEQALIDGLKSVSGQASTLYSAEWRSGSIGTSDTHFGTQVNMQGAYSFNGNTATQAANGYAASPAKPSYLLEEPYDEEGSDGTNKNASASQPTRRFVFRAMLAGANAGYCEGNGYLIHFFSGYASHFSTANQSALGAFNAWWKTKNWHLLVPDGVSPTGTLITAGKGTRDTTDSVEGALATDGQLAIFYGGPGFSSFTVDLSKMAGSITATWRDAASGATSSAGSFSNSGTHAFSSPGTNSGGDSDWFLVLTA